MEAGNGQPRRVGKTLQRLHAGEECNTATRTQEPKILLDNLSKSGLAAHCNSDGRGNQPG